jgi:hypothetical protein
MSIYYLVTNKHSFSSNQHRSPWFTKNRDKGCLLGALLKMCNLSIHPNGPPFYQEPPVLFQNGVSLFQQTWQTTFFSGPQFLEYPATAGYFLHQQRSFAPHMWHTWWTFRSIHDTHVHQSWNKTQYMWVQRTIYCWAQRVNKYRQYIAKHSWAISTIVYEAR